MWDLEQREVREWFKGEEKVRSGQVAAIHGVRPIFFWKNPKSSDKNMT
jgi:hypothetical protein